MWATCFVYKWILIGEFQSSFLYLFETYMTLSIDMSTSSLYLLNSSLLGWLACDFFQASQLACHSAYSFSFLALSVWSCSSFFFKSSSLKRKRGWVAIDVGDRFDFRHQCLQSRRFWWQKRSKLSRIVNKNLPVLRRQYQGKIFTCRIWDPSSQNFSTDRCLSLPRNRLFIISLFSSFL